MSQPPIKGDQLNFWRGEWSSANSPYGRNDQVRDGEWTMIANKETSDRAGPVTNGEASHGYPDTFPPWIDNQDTAVVETEHTYTFTEAGWIQGIRIWISEVTAQTKYRVFVVDETDPAVPVARILEVPPLSANTWNTIAIGSLLVGVGTILRVGLWAVDQASTTSFTGGWIYEGSSSSAPSSDAGSPSSVAWNHSNNQKILRINQVDLDSIDYNAQLGGVLPGSTIRFLQTDSTSQFLEYLVVSDPTDQGTYYEYDVELIDVGPGGTPDVLAVTTGDFTVPVPSTTKYVSLTDYWLPGSPNNYPSWATITSKLKFDGVEQGSPVDTNDGYGVDLHFQPASFSDDWDIVSTSANGVGIASGASFPLLAPSGTAADPSYTFDSNTDAGMYQPAVDQLGFSTNGLQRFEIDTDGTLAVTTAAYESLIADDNDIPNKKYVDDGDTITPINSQSGLTYTLVLSDAGSLVGRDNAASNTVTVPLNSNVAFPIGTQIIIENEGVGQTEIISEGSPPVTLNSADSLFKLTSQFSTATLLKKGTDTWLLAGDLV